MTDEDFIKKYDEDLKNDVVTVEELCDRIGYGNVMNLASVIWSIKQERKYHTTFGVFIPTPHQNISPEFWKLQEQEINLRKKQIIDFLQNLEPKT